MVDFNGLFNAIHTAMTSAASIDQDTTKIDTKAEKKVAKNIFKGVNKSAQSQVKTNMDVVEFNNLVAKEKSEVESFASDDAEIMADLMSVLKEMDPSIDENKVNKYNQKPNNIKADVENREIITTSANGYIGMDGEDYDTISKALGKDSNKVFKYMAKSIKKGDATRIQKNIASIEDEYNAQIQEAKGDVNIIKAMGAQKDVTIAKNVMAALQNGDDTRAEFMA